MFRSESFAPPAVNQNINWLWPCEYVTEVANRPKSYVPHYLPGKNPFLKELIDRTHLPEAAVQGGPETMMPEYRKDMTKLSSHEAPLVHPNGPAREVAKWKLTPFRTTFF